MACVLGVGRQCNTYRDYNTGFFEAWLRCTICARAMAPDDDNHRGPDALSWHRRPGYPLSGCVPAEPNAVSPGIPERARILVAVKAGKPHQNSHFSLVFDGYTPVSGAQMSQGLGSYGIVLESGLGYPHRRWLSRLYRNAPPDF